MDTERIDAWLRTGTAADFDSIVADYSLPEAVSALMKRDASLNAQAEIAERLQGAKCLERVPKAIHTIGVFYYRAFQGGIERVMARLITLWAEAGYRVVLLTDQPAHPDDYPLPEGVKRFLLPDTFGLNAKSRRLRFSRLREVLIKEQVDAFVHHAWLSRNMLWDLLAVKGLGIPMVVYTHGPVSCLLAEGDLEDMDEITRLTSVYPLLDQVISLSGTFDYFWSQFTSRTTVMLDPCTLPELAQESAGRKHHQLLWAGRITAMKKPQDAVRILAEVRRTVPDATLVVVGSASEEDQPLEAETKALADSLGLADSVEWAGFQKEMGPYYRRAGILLSTSAYEGFGLTIAEAKQAGIPCVMYELPYLYFAEQNQGLVSVRQGDTARAAAEIVRLMTDEAAYKAMAAASKESAKVFSDAEISRRWQEIFRQLEQAAPPVQRITGRESTLLRMLLDHTHAGLEIQKSRTVQLRQNALNGLLNSVYDDRYYVDHHQDMKEIYGYNQMLLLKHFLEHGIFEGRRACEEFDVDVYRANYPDLEQAYGNDLIMYYLHYMIYGKAEGRKGC